MVAQKYSVEKITNLKPKCAKLNGQLRSTVSHSTPEHYKAMLNSLLMELFVVLL